MNFNFDDPLADLLSDNSVENDSFFDNPPGGATKKSRVSANKKKGSEELFGIKEEAEKDDSPDTPGPSTHRQMATSTPRITKQKPSQSNDDETTDDLGFDPRRPKSGPKVNLLDDLLDATDAKLAAPTTSTRRESSFKAAISRQSTDTTTDNSHGLISQARPKTSTGRRSSGNSAVVNTDPLGLFGGGDIEHNLTNSGMSTPTPKARKQAATADWLGLAAGAGDNKTEERPPPAVRRTRAEPTPPINRQGSAEILKLPDTAEDEDVLFDQADEHTHTHTHTPYTTTQNILLMNSVNLKSKHALESMKHQESQLNLAVQARNQEQALLEMQRKQDLLLQQQEKQFEALLQQQLQRQRQMEEHIKTQHERINAHIQLMMSQTSLFSATAEVSAQKDTTDVSLGRNAPTTQQVHPALEIVQFEADVKRLELEKQRLEDLVEVIKTNYERELELIENSYRKQLKVQEDYLGALEGRLRTDTDALNQQFQAKLEMLEAEKHKLKSDWESEVSALRQDHEDELRRVRKSHENDMEILKEEQGRMLDSIRQSKLLEFAAVQENGSYLDTLKMASGNLEHLSGDLQGLHQTMQLKIETLNREKERSLEARERKVEDAERRLKMCEDSADEERKRLMDLVSTLEFQLSKLSKESGEENWLLRQQMSALQVEKTAFEREKEFEKEKLLRDEKRIADLKQQQLAEMERAMAELQEERARTMVERKKLETEKKLHAQTDQQHLRLEVEAALKVAQDATKQADAERERCFKQHRLLEQQKRELIDKEHALRAKEDDLEQASRFCRMAEQKAKDLQRQAELAEQCCHRKIQLLQERLRAIDEKEVALSQERLLVAQARIEAHNTKAKYQESQCALCKMSAQNDEIKRMIGANPAIGGSAMPADAAPESYWHLLGQSNIVDHVLNEHLVASFQKMQASTNSNLGAWTESVLDDDSKELAMHNLDNEQ